MGNEIVSLLAGLVATFLFVSRVFVAIKRFTAMKRQLDMDKMNLLHGLTMQLAKCLMRQLKERDSRIANAVDDATKVFGETSSVDRVRANIIFQQHGVGNWTGLFVFFHYKSHSQDMFGTAVQYRESIDYMLSLDGLMNANQVETLLGLIDLVINARQKDLQARYDKARKFIDSV